MFGRVKIARKWIKTWYFSKEKLFSLVNLATSIVENPKFCTEKNSGTWARRFPTLISTERGSISKFQPKRKFWHLERRFKVREQRIIQQQKHQSEGKGRLATDLEIYTTSRRATQEQIAILLVQITRIGEHLSRFPVCTKYNCFVYFICTCNCQNISLKPERTIIVRNSVHEMIFNVEVSNKSFYLFGCLIVYVLANALTTVENVFLFASLTLIWL